MADEQRSMVRVDEGGDLAREGGTRAPDLYEAQYMSGEGMVLYRAKARAPAWLQSLFLLPAVGMLVGAILAPGGWMGAAVTVPVMFLLWTLFSVLRVTVSEGAVNIQYGLFGPKIPIGAIESAEATTYHWAKFGGWGIKRSLDGEWIYNMPGDQGRAVRIVWRDARGRRRVTWIGSRENQAIVEAIRRARRALPPAADEG